MAKEKLLIVDDDPAIRLALKTAFAREGMVIAEAPNGTEALKQIRAQKFDLVILDVMMQDMDGYTVLQKMRAGDILTPVLLLSGKQTETDQVLGLGLGADDYLTKPFHISILIQKVKALIRRNSVYNQNTSNSIRAGCFTFDLMRLECCKDGVPLNFTAKELTLFRFFMEHPGQVFTKGQLYSQVWNDAVIDDNTIMVYIKRIREKIEDDIKNPQYIKTIRGIGYRFDAHD